MGGQCSARLAREGPGCVRLPPIGHCQEHCDPCDDGDHADLTTEHPLLLRRQQELQGQDSTPRTPRGPEPPWAQHGGERRDRTATGATPPRSPTPPRSVPPGLPPEDAPAIESVITLAGSFGTDFVEELFRFVRKGDMANITTQIQRVNHAAFSLMGGPGGFANGNMSASDRSEGAAELTAELLNKVREGSSGSTLLGAAAESGHVLATHALLLHKADPAIADAKGNTPLHKAAQTGSLLTSLVLLDRLQSNDRSASIAALANADGETPETAAATAAAAGANVELYHAFEVYQKMQKDAQHRQLGSVLASDPTGHRISTGDAVALVDLAVEVPSAAEANAAALLRRCCVGTALVPNLFQRIPDDQEQLAALVERVCSGLRTAEDFLRRQHWDPSDPGLDPALRSLVATADLRSQWQKIRAQAIGSKKGMDNELDDFWQTHLTADAMVSTMRQAVGDTFQLLLTALWLYTREAWLRHLLDALSVALCASHTDEGNRGGTGSAPEPPLAELAPAFAPVAPLVEALAPCMQLVQSALSWFEEANIRHTAVTYRPLLLPMLGLQKLVDRYVASRKTPEPEKERRLESGFWLSLGGGSFFSALSSRSMAISRLAKTRCNVLLIIRPDEISPSFPKHMSLRGNNVDDSLFSLETIFRIGRITRTVSTELDVDGSSSFTGPNCRWPVIIIEVYSVSCYTEAMELLQERGQLRSGELLSRVEEWTQCAPPDREADRLYAAGLLLSKVARSTESNFGGRKPRYPAAELNTFKEKAKEKLLAAAACATAGGHWELAAQAAAAAEELSSKKVC